MRLVYPIYLDTLMMTGFLASIEGGLVEEADLERREGNAVERTSNASLKAGVSGLLSGIFSGGADAGLSREVSESLESQYKGTVRFPNAALFIRLRELLLAAENIVEVVDEGQLSNVEVGDIVEFQGVAMQNPAQQIQSLFEQLFPILAAAAEAEDAKLIQQQVEIEAAQFRKGMSITIGEQDFPFETRKDLKTLVTMFETMRKVKQAELTSFEAIGNALQTLFTEHATTGSLVFEAEGFRVVCRVYPAFARNEQISDIYDAHWRCLGKVIDVIPAEREYNLLKGAPAGYIAREHFGELATALDNEHFRLETTDPVVHGPALVVATLAIFA